MPQDQATWEQFTQAVSAFVSRRVAQPDVDDVVQEILVRASRNIGRVREPGRLEPWLRGIARRVIADHYRKREHSPLAKTDVIDPELPDERATSPENLSSYEGTHDVHEEVLSWLRPLADKIDEPYRTALIRADFDKIPQRQLATELGLSDSGLKSRVQRARVMLGTELKECCEVEFGGAGRAISFRRLRCTDC